MLNNVKGFQFSVRGTVVVMVVACLGSSNQLGAAQREKLTARGTRKQHSGSRDQVTFTEDPA